jgi:hypothetical protein
MANRAAGPRLWDRFLTARSPNHVSTRRQDGASTGDGVHPGIRGAGYDWANTEYVGLRHEPVRIGVPDDSLAREQRHAPDAGQAREVRAGVSRSQTAAKATSGCRSPATYGALALGISHMSCATALRRQFVRDHVRIRVVAYGGREHRGFTSSLSDYKPEAVARHRSAAE